MDSRMHMGKVLVSVAVFVTLLTVLSSDQVYAQVAGATLSGVITDNSGAAPVRNNILFDGNGSRVGSGGRLDSTATTSRQIQFGLKVIW